MLLFEDGKSVMPCKTYLRRCALRLAGLLLLATALLLVAARLGPPRVGQWLAYTLHIERADAIVVLAGGNPGRIMRAITLYKQGLAPELWHTGNVWAPDKIMPPAQSGAQLAIEHGVPAEAIHLLATTNTWGDSQEIAVLAKERQVQSILIVTDWWHSRRALCAIKKQLAGSGIAVYYAPPTDPPYSPENWWHHKRGRITVFQELGKIGFYWVRYGVAPWRCELQESAP